MKLLVLGGTRFVGRALANDAVARGWDVTILNRGATAPAPDAGPTSCATRAVDSGLRCRPAQETVRDTWAWLERDGMPAVRENLPRNGLPPEPEARLLARVKG